MVTLAVTLTAAVAAAVGVSSDDVVLVMLALPVMTALAFCASERKNIQMINPLR